MTSFNVAKMSWQKKNDSSDKVNDEVNLLNRKINNNNLGQKKKKMEKMNKIQIFLNKLYRQPEEIANRFKKIYGDDIEVRLLNGDIDNNNLTEMDNILNKIIKMSIWGEEGKDKKTRDSLSNEITLKGVKNECKLSRKVIEIFVEVLADTAGDLALFTLPSGGIYLLGGISVTLESFMKESDLFMKKFVDKDHSFMLKNFPIYLVKSDNVGMLGATEAARRLLEED